MKFDCDIDLKEVKVEIEKYEGMKVVKFMEHVIVGEGVKW